ncbi:PAS domain S-box protein [Neobacillus sp. PS3-40]|uniref:PAS domain S-box protein n=1 Tax=Neobacillus sp. PS3-40 TaxID=3070679 RepID=UPI0027E1E125|nr:PAS domain S-box protein [Neobacillus sp. PS3-40]WML44222.1 PAS domain S-box protein [Neobacillus sp. PS3-40]
MKKRRLLIFYFIASFIWIYGTNYVVHLLTPAPFEFFVERLKEIFYVVVTGAVFYSFIRKTEELSTSKQDEKRLSTLINSMVDIVVFKDGEGRWIEANKFVLQLFQLEHIDYRGKKDSELAEYTDFYRDSFRNCVESDAETWKNGKNTRVEEIIPLTNGTFKTFDTIKIPLYYSDGSRQGLVIIGRDITEGIFVKKQLEESQQQYKSLFKYNLDMVYMVDLNGTIIKLNPQFEQITGYVSAEIIGKNISHILPEQYKETVMQQIATVSIDKKPVMYEINIPHKTGKNIILQCTFLPSIVDGKIAGIIGYGRDITTLRQTEERLRISEKLSVVGELSASVAHEIRNPLTSLIGFVQLLQVEDQKHQFYYTIMMDELTRINHIVGELLLLAKPQHLKFQKADIKKIMFDVISLLNTEANLYNIQIDSHSAQQELWIECEPNQLKQLFINLIKNAIEASTSGQKVQVLIEKVEKDKISIAIKDVGIGISKERLEKIGEPFYSSKEKGTGLGLTVSFKIVQSHNGTIQFESKLNQGTSVHIVLPMYKENANRTGSQTEPN